MIITATDDYEEGELLDFPVCPHCHNVEYDYENFSGNDGDILNATCNECGNDFVVELVIDICYKTWKAADE